VKEREKPDAVIAKKRGSHAKHATAVAIPDRYMICPGSGIIHPQAFLRAMQGQNCKFIRCPFHECKVTLFLNGDKWNEVDFGVTRDQVNKMNPGALIL